MANRVVIEIEADFKDTGGEKARRFEKQLDNLEKKTKRLGGVKAQARLDAVDNASQKIGQVTAKAESLTGKVFRFGLGAVDGATKVIGGIASTAKSLIHGAYNLTIGVIDKVTAPVRNIIGKMNSVLGLAGLSLGGYGMVVKPIQMQVEYENLTTAFDVLLGGADKAEKRIDDLTAFAGQTPFTRDELYASNRVLEVYTKGAISSDPEQRGGMKMVGDIAAAVNGDYQDVANWVGRLYSSMETGGAVGIMTNALQNMGALGGEEREAIEKLSENVKKGNMNISQAWDGVADIFDRFDGTMEKQSNKLGNLLLGVKSFVNNNFMKNLGAGFSDGLTPFLKDFRTWRSENKELIAGWGEQTRDFARNISTRATTAVRKLAGEMSDMMSGSEWKNSSFAGKINIAWNKIIADPFKDWWQSSGKKKIASTMSNMGAGLGEGMSNGLLFLLGIDVNSAIDDGANIGTSFITGFKSKFDKKAIANAFKDAITEAPAVIGNLWGKMKSGFTSLKSTFKEVIFNPLEEWWSGGGKSKVVAGATQVGTWLGEGITNGVKFLSSGILTLLGIENDGVMSDASEVGKGFWGAFTDSFDGAAVTDAIFDAIVGVWSRLPAEMKMLLGGYGASKVFSGIAPMIGAGKSIAGFVGSAGTGTGLLGHGANAAIRMGAGNLSSTASLGAGAMSALGLGGIAGGVIGGATLISGVKDIYSAANTEGAESSYNAWKGGSKVTGALGGAAIGAGIGTVVPVIGTAIGGLIGAGVGGLAGTFGGELLGKSISGYDEAEIKRMQALEKALTGYSESTKNVLRQTKLTVNEFQALKRTKIDEWYGDVSLSAKEVSEYAGNTFKEIVGNKQLKSLDKYKASLESLARTEQTMSSANSVIKETEWRIKTGIKLDVEDAESYVSAIESYVSGAQEYISQKQFSIVAAISAVFDIGDKEGLELASTSSQYFDGIRSQVATLSEQISGEIQKGWDEGSGTYNLELISTDQIAKWQEELSQVTEKLGAARLDAKMEALRIQHGGTEMDADSVAAVMQEMETYKQSALQDQLDASEQLISFEYLLHADGEISDSELEANIAAIEKKYSEFDSKLNLEVGTFELSLSENAMSEAAASAEKLRDSLYKKPLMLREDSFINPDWNEAERMYANGGEMPWDNWAASFAPDQSVLDRIKENALQSMAVLQEELGKYENLGIEPPKDLVEGYNAAMEALDYSNLGAPFMEQLASMAESEGFLSAKESLLNAGTTWADGVMEGMAKGLLEMDPSDLKAALAVVEHNSTIEAERMLSGPLEIEKRVYINFKPTYSEMPQPRYGGAQSVDIFAGQHATGGFVSGKQLSWVGEEGPEAIIPLVPGRRGRGLELWTQAGKALGVLENANGGIVGGNITPLFSTPEISNETRISQSEEKRKVEFREYAATSSKSNSNKTSVSVQNGAVQIHIHAAQGQSVTEVIRENLEDIGEQVADVIASKMGEQFENTPATA
jgi:Mu-like prophage protein